MPRYNPRTHVFNYGGVTPKDRRERFAIEEFCKRMRVQYKASYHAMRLDTAVDQGLIKIVDGSTVDGVLRTSRGPVAIELLGYAPVDDRGDVLARDLEFRKLIKPSIFDALKAKMCSLSLDYREKRRPGSPPGTVRTVPSQRDFTAAIKELRLAIAAAPMPGFNRFVNIRFVKAEDMKHLNSMRDSLCLDEALHRVCAAHIGRIRLQGIGPELIPNVDSSLHCGHVGLDCDWVRNHLAKKAEKSLKQSRPRANGLPLWLIVHSDGRAINQTIPEPHRIRALELCREVLSVTGHGFTRAYWADRTGFLDAAWVGRVL